MNDRDRVRREEDLKGMQDYDKWPAFPFLPLKRRRRRRRKSVAKASTNILGFPETGILIAAHGVGLSAAILLPHHTTTVFDANLFALPKNLADLKVLQEYPSFEAILDDGWEVD